MTIPEAAGGGPGGSRFFPPPGRFGRFLRALGPFAGFATAVGAAATGAFVYLDQRAKGFAQITDGSFTGPSELNASQSGLFVLQFKITPGDALLGSETAGRYKMTITWDRDGVDPSRMDGMESKTELWRGTASDTFPVRLGWDAVGERTVTATAELVDNADMVLDGPKASYTGRIGVSLVP